MTIPIKRATVCRHCSEGTGIIHDPTDLVRTADGDLKCLKCVEEDTRKMLIRVRGQHHPKNQDFISAEQRKVDQWNALANKVNSQNKRMGGNKDILPLKRNKYLT
jgi:hypothetical protein